VFRRKATIKSWLSAFLAICIVLPVLYVPQQVAAAGGEGLLTNPGFELGDTGWEKWGNPVVSSTEKHSGTNSLHVVPSSGGASQTVQIEEGRVYQIGVWIKLASAGVALPDMKVDLFGGGGNGDIPIVIDNQKTEWQYSEVLYTAAEGRNSLRLSFWNGTGEGFYMDDVVIREYTTVSETPAIPTELNASPLASGLLLEWQSSPNNTDTVEYEVAYKTAEAADWTTTIVPHQNTLLQSHILTSLAPMTQLLLSVKARNSAGNASEPALIAAATGGVNKIANADFESGSLSNWENWGGMSINTTIFKDGTYAATVANQGGGASKSVAIEAGKSYALGFWMKLSTPTSSGTGLVWTLFAGSETQHELPIRNTTEWQYVHTTCKSDKEGLARFSFWNTSGSAYVVDGFYLAELPEASGGIGPAQPDNAAVTSTSGLSATLTWDAPTAGNLDISEYRIAYQEQGATTWTRRSTAAIAGQQSYTDTLSLLLPKRKYNIQLSAVNEAGLESAKVNLSVTTGEVSPVNANATAEAKQLLQKLYDTTGKGILSGQHNYYEVPNESTALAEQLTGYHPALWGSDFAYYTGGDIHALRQAMTDTAAAKWNSGTLVALTYHQIRPNDPITSGWESVQGTYTEQEMEELVTPGTTLYQKWEQSLAVIVPYLKQLQTKKVPVLWRPYHEMNATWFWWGGKPEQFKKLWINMYNYLTIEQGLDNLIWVWNPNAINEWTLPMEAYYPGHEYVDALAVDIYNNDYKASDYEALLALGGGRPIAIGENGELPNIGHVEEHFPRYVWFMTWPSHLTGNNSIPFIQSTFAHAYTINNGETGNGPYIPPLPESYIIDDFSGYGGSNETLAATYRRNESGNKIAVSLKPMPLADNAKDAMRIEYTLGTPSYAGLYRQLSTSWKGSEAIELKLRGDGSGHNLTFQFHEKSGEVWETTYTMNSAEEETVRLPFKSFVKPDWAKDGNGKLEVDDIKEVGLYFGLGEGKAGNGVVYIERMKAVKLTANPNANLQDLSVSGVSLQPAFKPEIYAYTGTATADTAQVGVILKLAEGPKATINGENAVSGEKHEVRLQTGSNRMTIVVTAADQLFSQTYTLDITKQSPQGNQSEVFYPGISSNEPDIRITLQGLKKLAEQGKEAELHVAGLKVFLSLDSLKAQTENLEFSGDKVNSSTELSALQAWLKEAASGAQVVGEPISIRTNLKGKARIEIPLASLTEKLSLLEARKLAASLQVLVKGNKGEASLVKGQLKYDGANPLAIELETDQFGLLTLVTTTSKLNVYSDDKFISSYASSSVYDAQELGLMIGSESGKFDPSSTLTRAQLAKLLTLIMQPGTDYSSEKVSWKMPFTDVTTSHWAYGYIAGAYKLGLTTGYQDGTFRPEEPITREQFAVMIGRALNESYSDTDSTELSYNDFDRIASYARPYIQTLTAKGIMQGDGNSFAPDAPVTREMAAVIAIRLLEVLG